MSKGDNPQRKLSNLEQRKKAAARLGDKVVDKSVKRYGAAALSAALASMLGPGALDQLRDRMRRGMIRESFKRFGKSRYRPHQGPRECARRVGRPHRDMPPGLAGKGVPSYWYEPLR